MKRRLFVGSIILVCCGCSTASMHTEVASTKWRMENLEQRFLDFRERAALREAGLSTRIAKLEKQLGLPVPTQEEMIAESVQLTPEVHVFSPTDGANTAAATSVDNDGDPEPSANESAQPATKNADEADSQAVADEQQLEDETSAKPSVAEAATPPAPTNADSPVHPFTKSSAQPQVDEKASSSAQPSEASSPQAAAASVPSSSQEVSTPSPTAKDAQPSSAPRVVAQHSDVPVPKKTVRPPAKKTGSTSMYKHGLELLEKGRYVEGRERLEEFLTEFPRDPLTPNAVYWVGEAYYSQKDYLIAVDVFREVLNRFPESSKAKSAMLKIGYSFERMNELSEARRYLLKVVEKYPKSNEARLARKMLSGI
ncbi:tol-pal system protein YbgF [Halodesulfovibrio aestuarii]|uniref:Tol-pal system protein YbgF n=1 Tax=Halodesulfovibrio aestuarii TaxID=126333 RepID=A0A8G2C8D7_9BACT|nr:tol-pal system protein YbgF [Halodesulfovibrio aestuarii]SHI79954.1 tol-pal system protein YbgF [Halodesulfovibrio aestuarii]